MICAWKVAIKTFSVQSWAIVLKMFGSHRTEVKTVGIKNEKGRGFFYFFFQLQGDSILEEGDMRESMIQHEERVMSGTS